MAGRGRDDLREKEEGGHGIGALSKIMGAGPCRLRRVNAEMGAS